MRSTRLLVACLVAIVAAAVPVSPQQRAPVTVTLVRWPYT
jgi:hypothetical protein